MINRGTSDAAQTLNLKLRGTSRSCQASRNADGDFMATGTATQLSGGRPAMACHSSRLEMVCPAGR
jgi:hypothetical protein